MKYQDPILAELETRAAEYRANSAEVTERVPANSKISFSLTIDGELSTLQCYVQRVAPWGNAIHPDTESVYRWQIQDSKDPDLRGGWARHRAGDGAWALVAKVLREAGF